MYCSFQNEQPTSIDVKDISYIPKLTTNLLSVSRIIKKRDTVRFHENIRRIFNEKSQLIARANKIQ